MSFFFIFSVISIELRKHVEWVVPGLTNDQWVALSELFDEEDIFRIEDIHYVEFEVLSQILKKGLAHRLLLHSEGKSVMFLL